MVYGGSSFENDLNYKRQLMSSVEVEV